ncbi:RNA methyltransferase [Micromonospora sp. WMMC250]|nr:RNA methyltransferase [Micromonospora sp. WMMC250]MCZ7375382.1 RNA methyltransferase [Micromonospora sp. WMMC250]
MSASPSGGRLDRAGGANPMAFTPRTPRIVAARRLQRRRDRDATGRFLAEGPQAVREALARPGVVTELFGTPAALDRYPELAATAARADVPVSEVTDDALAALTETVAPQGLVAVCQHLDVTLEQALAGGPRLVAVLAEIRDPGNAGTVLRTADAAGAGAVIFAGDAVDPYNGKCVRASAGSLFHVDVVRAPDPVAVVDALRAAGLSIFATTGYGDDDLDDLTDYGRLVGPTAWLFGSEAHGLPEELTAAADARVRVPLYGRAESLNLAAAAAVCLYASARAQR